MPLGAPAGALPFEHAPTAPAPGHPRGPAPPEARPERFLSRLRVRTGLAFLVSLGAHSTLLAFFLLGMAPGVPDAPEAISVEIVTQEQLDIMLGAGSARGGEPEKVEDAADGAGKARRSPVLPAPEKAEADAARKDAPRIVSARESAFQVPAGAADSPGPASAASGPRKAEAGPGTRGNPQESEPGRRTDPKERPESQREASAADAPPSERDPGADGGEMRRVASRGSVGDQAGPLPPTMRQAMMQLLQKQIQVCYVPPAGTAAGTRLPLVLIRLHRDGSLNGAPKSIRHEGTASEKLLARAALKAVRQCAPYRMPPRYAPYHADWKEIRAEFDFVGD